MIKKIEKNSKVFNLSSFEADKYLFSIILNNLSSDSLELYSDEENYIFCRGQKDLPTWIWTKENFDLDVMFEIEMLIDSYLTNSETDRFTCKPSLYRLLLNNENLLLNDRDCSQMLFLICDKIKKPKGCDGFLNVPNIYDIDILSRYYYEGIIEKKGKGVITYNQVFQYVSEIVNDNYSEIGNNNTIYTWKNNRHEIVSMAVYSSLEGCSKINNVYTIPEARGKCYASNLVYYITLESLNDGMVPIVYINNNKYNNLYRKVGYVNHGMLVNFCCSKNKVKKKL